MTTRARQVATGLAVAAGWIGSAYGVLMTLYVASRLRYLDETIRVAVVGVGLYALAFYLVTTRKPVGLVVVLLVIVPLNVLSLASVGLPLIPATALLVVSSVLYWVGVGRCLVAMGVPLALLLVAALTVAAILRR